MENNKENNIVIVGSGVAGLTAAIELEKAGFAPTIIEMTSEVGGRIKTDSLEGFQLDHGFQVLLTAYPEANRYLDMADLKLNYFNPGAIVFDTNKTYEISDPLRDPSKSFSMLFSPVGSLRDKYLMWKLTTRLKRKSLEDIFGAKSISTLKYLSNYGFSSTIINNFFKPFFGGIFLENKLETSSRMFEFVFKMFGEGRAAIPAKGMGAIPNQMAGQLKSSKLLFDTKVDQVLQDQLVLENGDKIQFDRLIVATAPKALLKGFEGQSEYYESVLNIYFKTRQNNLKQPLIALVPDEDNLINNFCDLSSTSPTYAPKGNSLLSVSVNGIHDNTDAVIDKVKQELSQLAGYDPNELEYLKSYMLTNALPRIDDLAGSMQPSEVKIHENIFLAGDYLLNASLNAAMTSGRTAALALMNSI